MLLKLYEKNTNPKQLAEVVNVLNCNGVIVYPTDSVYAIGCSINSPKAIQRILQITHHRHTAGELSLIFDSISHIAEYTKPISNDLFRVLKRNLPGPFTFIMEAGNRIPKTLKQKRKTIGVRIPDNNIILEVVRMFGAPIITTSVHDEDEVVEYTTDPELIDERLGHLVDLVIDGGIGNNIPSTVVDCCSNSLEIIREGAGEIQ
ncbi:L-threonylcarbamoyladenylate synthase [Bacteroidales bacterium]|nr:L-threonylcarbamoyladenylate synthase [Bacteroidales bacterium]